MPANLYKILARSSLLVLPVVSVIIGYVIGDFMGLRGWWLFGLTVIEAMIGLVAGIKLLCLT
jgi:hypothetical protein